MINADGMAILTLDNQSYDLSNPIDISIPLRFNGPQPNAYGVEPARSIPCAAGDLVGDTRKGGSCNFEQYTFIPHCNGTHTECVGHITHERISIRDSLQEILVPAVLITIDPVHAGETVDSYSMAMPSDDLVITRRLLEQKLSATPAEDYAALIIRTNPNDEEKLSRRYLDYVPPYLTSDAMQFIVERNFKHLLIDLPSIDRLHDEGRLSNHRVFWNVEQGSFETNANTRRDCTITELIFVPGHVGDGLFLLNLQIAPFTSDASPSRPLLFRLGQK